MLRGGGAHVPHQPPDGTGEIIDIELAAPRHDAYDSRISS
jgi:hypothetical protein